METCMYTTVIDDNIISFERRVNQYLSNGWKCQGGISTTTRRNDDIQYSQAMILQK